MRRLLLTALAATGVVLAGCTGSAGPFGPSFSDHVTSCAEVPAGRNLSFGIEYVRNHGSQPATVSKVTLASPHGLDVMAVWSAPVRGRELYGLRTGWPAPARQAGWQSVAGAMVPAGGTRNLILVVKPTARTGHADGLAIDYQESGQSFQLVISTRLNVRVGASCS